MFNFDQTGILPIFYHYRKLMIPLRSPNDLFRPEFIGKMDAFTAWVLRTNSSAALT